jgi:hypothetical protein
MKLIKSVVLVALRLRVVRILLLCACLVLASPLQAAEVKSYQAQYGMFVGGLNMVTVTGGFEQSKGTYKIDMSAFTRGVLGSLAPWKGVLATTGTLTKTKAYTPQTHVFSNWWKGREERTSLVYDSNGSFKLMSVLKDGVQSKQAAPKPELTAQTHDILTALAMLLHHLETTKTCNLVVPVFDGKRKFNMKFTDEGDGEIQKGSISVYAGRARMCTVEIVPIAGKWHEKPRGWMSIQEQAKAGKKLPRLWIARPRADTPLMPVRFDVFTQYGNVITHLINLK